ncbi:MAG: 7-cyano-7-deazaguanine synthase QueC [Magnetococcales bacterium]|nr:7-cyano-7-deazaguanine synthase QueC [Magnetococcales bacterium]
MSESKALVLFSGGQDSTICLAWALTHYPVVETVGFDYGQRHAVELRCRPSILAALRDRFPHWAPRLHHDHCIDLQSLGQLSDSSLTKDLEIKLTTDNLPDTFVPGRNLIFFTFAAAVAYRRGINVLVGGMCETDYSGYPDCRDDAIKALQVCLNIGMAAKFRLETPLMWFNKGESWQMARNCGGDPLVELVRTETHSCYKGERLHLHPWGFGCAQCPACLLRAKGYESFLNHLDGVP